LPGHAQDVAPGDASLDPGAQRDAVGEVEAQIEGLGRFRPLEVLGEVAGHVGRPGQRWEHIDEAEELGLERRPLHGPVHDPVAPPRCVEHPGARARTQFGDAAGERDRVPFDLGGHRRSTYRRTRRRCRRAHPLDLVV
jgi:hypothetical protein